ncbi:MAG: 6-bladed beta-propeller [Candidatus Poribacteria bacterium]|nr:6-bladed beta-propeller [Candidatus Poribacteria bacterium]
MPKAIILFCASCLFFACNQNADVSQNKPSLQPLVSKTENLKKTRIEKISEIHLKENEKAYIGAIKKIKVDENRIYLMDKSLKQILVFSFDGEFIRALGRSGEGPGEFRFLYTMDIKDHLIACFDQGTRRITLFDTSGVFIRSFGTQSQKSVPSGNCVAITPHHTILHCHEPKKYPKKQWLSHTYPYLICEFDSLGNVLSHYGKFNQQIVGDKLDKPLTEFEWSFPHFIASGNSQTYLWFANIPLVVKYDESNEISKAFNVATPITKPKWVDKDRKKKEEEMRHLSNKEKMMLAIQLMKNDHSTTTQMYDIAYVDKHKILLTLQTEEERRDFPHWTRTRYLSAYDVHTGQRLMTDIPLQSKYETLAVDQDGFFYCIQSDKPDNFVIAKYEIIRGEI